MGNILQKINKRKLAAVLVLLVVLALSMTVVQKAASDPENHTGTIEALDEKKADVLKLTASSAAAATALAAVPGDATTPVANKLADLTSYFLIVLMVVFLEKYLVTLTGYATFFILIPLACVLLGIGICAERPFLKVLARKVAAFGLVLFLIIPISMHVSGMIEATYEQSMETAVEEAENITEEINESTDEDGNVLEQALTKLKDGVSGLLDKGEALLNHFIETIAVMMVTSCVIPVVILVFLLWLVKVIFGIQVSVPKDVPKKISAKVGKRKEIAEK